MSIYDLFSKRQKRLRGDVPDVYTYDKIPEPLRVQIVHVWTDALGNEVEYENNYHRGPYEAYRFIVDALCREYGLFRLDGSSSRHRDYRRELVRFFLEVEETDKVLDTIEFSFRLLDTYARGYDYRPRVDNNKRADEAIEELNGRLKEHGIGYEYSDQQLIRIDSLLVHSEVVKPALQFLSEQRFAGAREEYLKAFEHYRRGRDKESLNESLKALESVLKTICRDRKWKHDTNATAKSLLDVCFSNGLIPVFWQSQYSSLRALLESSVPTGRNKLSGHGQGPDPVSVEKHIVAYMLHMTASAIVFLVSADKDLR